MKAVIDRIEDGKTAVLMVIGGGEMIIPVKQFRCKLHEGMWFDVVFKPNKKAESKSLARVKKLQQELMHRSNKE
ncbi:MAG TPA: hypothetical protein DCX95_01220 [Elusimicrobia bacterium]|nr:hypothetical protein [Elusimicrobiota bacterium]